MKLNCFDTGCAIWEEVSGSISVQKLSQISKVLANDRTEIRLRGFALASDRLAKANTSVYNANASVFVPEVSCSLSSSSWLLKSVTNLFNTWEILTHEWEFSLLTSSILISTPYLPCTQLVVTSNTGPILIFHRTQPFGSIDFSSLGKMYSQQTTDSTYYENSAVSIVMKYCPTPTGVRNPATIQLLTHSLLWEPFHSFLELLQQIFLRKIVGRRCWCLRQQTCWLKQCVTLSC